jgi:hypothetical protein
MTPLLTAVGLAAPAGLNAYLALFIVGLAARFTSLITLEPPYDVLASPWMLIVLGLLVGVEVFADKIPAVDTVNDLIGTVVRPVAGAVLALASTREVGLDPIVAAGLGLLLAGSVHGAKALTRPAITASTGGLGNPVVSMIEDMVAAAGVVLTLLAPLVGFILAVLLLVGMTALVLWVGRRVGLAFRRWRLGAGGGRGPAP